MNITAASSVPTSTTSVRSGRLARLMRDTWYVLAGFPLAVVSFSILVTLISTAVGLLVVWIGVPLAVFTLVGGSWLAAVERRRIRRLDGTDVVAHYAAPPEGTRSTLRAWRTIGTDPQRWRDLIHGVLVLPIATVTFSVVVSWWAVGLGGVTRWFWGRWVPTPEPNDTLAELMNLDMSDSLLNALVGVVFLATLVPVTRLCAAAHAAPGKALLGGPSRGALQARVESLTETRAAAADAEVHALRRLERDIHDGPQQRLVRLGMDLSVAERRLNDDPEAARQLVAEARQQTSETLAELRALTRGIAPPILTDRGLGAALLAVAARSTVRADVDVALPEGRRLPAAVESAAYFVVSEALTNVAKHSGAAHVHISARHQHHSLLVAVEDDGVGGAHPSKGHGLVGLVDRVAALDGVLTIDSPPGGPTTVRAEIPCHSE